MISATCIAPVNIAVIKYWGKRDETLILPVNDSISMTLATDQMCAKTTAAASSEFKENKFWLNGEEVPFDGNARMTRCLEACMMIIRSKIWIEYDNLGTAKRHVKLLAEKKTTSKFPLDWKIHICSENNFPTAAGLASSAAGYACLVYTLSCLLGIEENDLSLIARQGSGSACRSMYGGFVQWMKGVLDNGTDSIAVQIKPANHWPEMHVLILVVSDSRKKVSSTKGMLNSVKTSDLLQYRADKCVPERVELMRDAILTKDFQKFALLTMKDSNQFHAVCLDTYPPCVYMNDTSHAIVEFVHKYNEYCGEIAVAYTFDAGPNACIYLEEKNVQNVLAAINYAFPHDLEDNQYMKGLPTEFDAEMNFNESGLKINKTNLISYIIHTEIGNGPKKLPDDASLLNSDGLPIQLKNV